MRSTSVVLSFVLALAFLLGGCASQRVGAELKRSGQEIMVAGRLFHVGAPVVLWTDPGGYDAYRVERRFVAFEDSGWDKTKDAMELPNRSNLRYQRTATSQYTPEQLEQIRGGGWDLELLRERVDQFVIHYDVCGTSRTCFRVLHDQRGLSVHFMLDIDGTIYQTLDVKERAWHATIANDRSVGIEIAAIGAAAAPAGFEFAPMSDFAGLPKPLADWYTRDASGKARITLPARFGDGGVRTRNFVGFAALPEPVLGPIHGKEYVQFDFTPEQYHSLIKLTAALHKALPGIALDVPREPKAAGETRGKPLMRALTPDEFAAFKGLLGHFHVQDNKIDPGPAFRWDYVLDEARKLTR